MADVQLAIIDQQNTEVTVAVPGIQGIQGQTGDVAVAQDGTQGTPGIRFENDPNTGIYRPGDDQLAISTNGTGKLFVDASGNVGLGSSSPSTFGSSSSLVVQKNGTGESAAVNILGSSTGSSLIRFADGTATASERNAGSIIVNHNDGSMAFGLQDDEKLRITSTGELKHIGGGSVGDPAVYFAGSAPAKSLVVEATTGHVGVGTTSPGNRLTVIDRTTPIALKIGENNNATTAAGLEIQARNTVNTTGYALQIAVDADEPAATIDFNGSERARIDSSGTFRVKGAGTAGVNDAVQLNGSAPANSLLLDASGRLLVGTTTSIPVGSTTASNIQLVDSAAFQSMSRWVAHNGGPNFNFGKSRSATPGSYTIVQDGDGLGTITFAGDDGTDLLSIAARIQAFVDSGTSVTAGSFVVGRRYKIATVGTTDFNLIGASANTVGVIFQATGVGTGTGTATTEPYANSMPGRLVFSTTADGASSPTPRVQINSSGALQLLAGCPGIDFSAIQTNAAGMTSETLDSYEEGTFTPVIEGTTTAGTGTYSVQIGRYVKIGKTVTVWIRLTWSAHTGTGNGAIAALPFSSQSISGGNHPFAATIGYEVNYDVAANTVLSAYVEPNGTRIFFAQIGVGTQSGVGSAALDTAAGVTVSATYETA